MVQITNDNVVVCKVMANFMKVFLNHVRYGAEAMYECVQDPPKSGVDLEGA